MKAIQTYYIGPGNVRGARYVARDGDGNRVAIQADDTLNSSELHAKAARTLAEKMGWSGTMVKGWLKRGVWVWVWRQSGCNVADEIAIGGRNLVPGQVVKP